MSGQPEGPVGAVPITSGLLRQWSLPRSSGSKESSGRVLIVGGNTGMPGGILLAAEAAMRAGAGKLQVATVGTVAVHLAIAIPEGYVLGLPADADGNLTPAGADAIVDLADDCDAVVIGPGLMSPDAAAAVMRAVVPRLSVPVAIDALGLAYLTGNLDGVRHLETAVLSPNVKELFLTLGQDEPDPDRLPEATRELAAATGAVVVSGAEDTLVATPDGELWTDSAGGRGMAVSGSGDVKAGIIAGLLARGASGAQAGVWASHVHGRCGERLASRFGQRGYMARDFLPTIPLILTELES